MDMWHVIDTNVIFVCVTEENWIIPSQEGFGF